MTILQCVLSPGRGPGRVVVVHHHAHDGLQPRLLVLAVGRGAGVEGVALALRRPVLTPEPETRARPAAVGLHTQHYSVSGLSCPEAEAYLTVIFHSFQHNNNINSDYILGEIMYFSPHSNFSSYF